MINRGVEIIKAEATSNSEDGYVQVRINPVPSRIPTNVYVQAGDIVQIQTCNSRNPVVIGVVGAGDRLQSEFVALSNKYNDLLAEVKSLRKAINK